MAKTALKGSPVNTNSNLPAKGSAAADFQLTTVDLTEVSLKDFAGKRKVLNIFPSIDTSVCALSVKRFNQEAAALANTQVLNISQDLPFALKRFCGAEGINNAIALSGFRSSFAKDYGVEIIDSPMRGLNARTVILLDENNHVIYTELVSEITEEPNYEAALQALRG
jgi:thiol peroxidase